MKNQTLAFFEAVDERLSRIESALLAQKRVLTFEEGCRYTGFSPSYMYKLTSIQEFPLSKPTGKQIFIDREKLEEWLLSRSTRSGEEKDHLAADYVMTSRRA
jgi:excisionase family DNA binding protein